MTRAILFASALLLAGPVFAAEKGDAPPAATDAAICTDDGTSPEKERARQARLAELGRRLAAEAEASGESRALNRTGFNYDPRRPAPAVNAPPPAAPDTNTR